MTKRQKAGWNFGEVALNYFSVKAFGQCVHRGVSVFSKMSAPSIGHLKCVQLTSCPVCHAAGMVWRNQEKSSVSASTCPVFPSALEDLWFISCCFFYFYILDISYCEGGQNMSLVVVPRQFQQILLACYIGRQRRKLKLSEAYAAPTPFCLSACLSVWAVNSWSTISAVCFFRLICIICGI